jgi:hypothetical protein
MSQEPLLPLTQALPKRKIPATWTFLIYMEAGQRMSTQAIKNINAMTQGIQGNNNTIAVQVHLENNTAWRYLITPNKMNLVTTTPVGTNYTKELVSAMQWAVSIKPSQYYALILWNHGTGILDPTYNTAKESSSFPWEIEPDKSPDQNSAICLCPTPKSMPVTRCQNHVQLKGIMFSPSTKTYLTNHALIKSLDLINSTVLNNKKLDLLGADACMMAMLEIAYQIKPYVSYFVGSQNCELMDGWNYKAIFSHLSTHSCTPPEVATLIVQSYEKYYQPKPACDIYTQSAFDLSKIDQLISSLNQIVKQSLVCASSYQNSFRAAVANARAYVIQFCSQPLYCDLDCFLTQLLLELEKPSFNKNSEAITTLKELIKKNKTLIQNVIIANVTGESIRAAQGISLYFPYLHIDSSYHKTPFAKDTLWVEFLQSLIGCC